METEEHKTIQFLIEQNKNRAKQNSLENEFNTWAIDQIYSLVLPQVYTNLPESINKIKFNSILLIFTSTNQELISLIDQIQNQKKQIYWILINSSDSIEELNFLFTAITHLNDNKPFFSNVSLINKSAIINMQEVNLNVYNVKNFKREQIYESFFETCKLNGIKPFANKFESSDKFENRISFMNVNLKWLSQYARQQTEIVDLLFSDTISFKSIFTFIFQLINNI